MFGKIRCPSIMCRSTNIVPIDTKKKFSFGKAVVGGCIGSLINPIGTAVGMANGIHGKNGKTKFVCQNCGKVFEVKL